VSLRRGSSAPTDEGGPPIGVRDPVGGPGPPAVKARSFPSSGTRGVAGPVPEWGAGPGPLTR